MVVRSLTEKKKFLIEAASHILSIYIKTFLFSEVPCSTKIERIICVTSSIEENAVNTVNVKQIIFSLELCKLVLSF